ALRHSREEVADEARRELFVQLQRWQQLPPKIAARRLALLADELARDIDRAPVLAQSASAELATRMLLWPQPAGGLDNARFLAQGEAMRGRVGQPAGAAAQRGAAARRATPADVELRPVAPFDADLLSPLKPEHRLPGGGLPIEPQQPPPLPA